ncbi:hypothetical protein ACFO4O_14110 [Glaciecola siphonariae]|uniref:Uncharacterized protein n=1 Tax=Glaciecola siphonariae TaxID=521012 RepID=A0ABV9LZL5_9ALTE
MYLVIKGKLDLSNYFAVMVLSTILLVGVVIATSLLPFDKTGTALLMAVLSVVSLGSSMKVMSLVINQSRE